MPTIILLLLVLSSISFGLKTNVVIVGDKRDVIPLASFGFLSGGIADIQITDLTVEQSSESNLPSSPPKVLLYLEPVSHILDNDDISIPIQRIALCGEADHTTQSPTSKFKSVVDLKSKTLSYTHTFKEFDRNQYLILLIQCVDGYSLSGYATIKNQSIEGNYLSAGDMHLPKIFAFMAVCYLFTFAIWTWLLRRQVKVVWPHKVMWGMLLLLAILKFLNSFKYHYLRLGEEAGGWAISYNVMNFIKGFFGIMTFILISSGWVFIKPFLTEKDKRIISIIIPLQFVINAAQLIQAESIMGSVKWTFWNKLFTFVDFIACVAITIPIIQTRKHLSEASETDGKAAENLRRYQLWGSLYFLIIAYFYLTRIVGRLLLYSLNYDKFWVAVCFDEVVTLVFYITLGYKLRPASHSLYYELSGTENESDAEDTMLQDIESGASSSLQRLSSTSNSKII